MAGVANEPTPTMRFVLSELVGGVWQSVSDVTVTHGEGEPEELADRQGDMANAIAASGGRWRLLAIDPDTDEVWQEVEGP